MDIKVLGIDLGKTVCSLAGLDADMQRLMEILGIGPTIATALVAAVGTGSSFGKGRDLAAWLGLVPRQVTTGGKAKPGARQFFGLLQTAEGFEDFVVEIFRHPDAIVRYRELDPVWNFGGRD